MTDFKIGDKVWIQGEVWGYQGGRDRLVLEVGNGEVIANKANCRALVEADLAQAIREVLLSDEFMTAFAAAYMKTPLPLSMHFDDKDGEPILIDGLTPVWRTPEATINNTILPEAKPAKLDLAD